MESNQHNQSLREEPLSKNAKKKLLKKQKWEENKEKIKQAAKLKKKEKKLQLKQAKIEDPTLEVPRTIN